MSGKRRPKRAPGKVETEATGPGRPTLYTPELGRQICELISYGVPVKLACRAKGLGKQTYYDWRAKAEAGDPEYAQFMDDVNAAHAKCEADVTLNVVKASRRDWRAGAWWLEHARPLRYSKRATLRLEKPPSDMSDEEIRQALARMGYVPADDDGKG